MAVTIVAVATSFAVIRFVPRDWLGTEASAGEETQPNAAQDPDAVWAFVVRVNPPPAGAASQFSGSVVVTLTKTRGDADTSVANGTLPMEVAGVAWDARLLSAPPEGTIEDAMNAQFNVAPPLILTRAAQSRNQDAIEVVVSPQLNLSSVIVHAPLTGEFLSVHWPSGQPYAWSPPAHGWILLRDLLPSISARPTL